MSWQIVFSERALLDYENSFNWYKNISVGLAEKFSDVLFKSIEIIRQNPLSFAIKLKSFRQYPLPVFPFVLIFAVHSVNKEILIHSIFHTSRNPKNKFIKKQK